MMQTEPISFFYGSDGFDPNRVARYEIGEKYIGIMLDSGNIGVCAILEHKVQSSILIPGEPNLQLIGHRIILNAYYNALYNYTEKADGDGDIFDSTGFSGYRNIVMIGGFASLIEKFSARGTDIRVFDRLSDSEFMIPMRRQPEMLRMADCVILTGTTINNNTFTEIVSHTPDGCDIFLLGPSNILHRDMFRYRNIKVVFGSRFRQWDEEVLDLIKKGHGTKGFLKNLNKVYISAPDFTL
jgi:hypothetical protein